MPFITLAGTLIAGGMASNASKKASQAQSEGTNLSIDETSRQNNINQYNQQPYLGSGRSAMYKISDLLGLQRQAPVAPTKAQFAPSGDSQKVDWDAYNNAVAQYQQDMDLYNLNKGKSVEESFQEDPGYQFRVGEGNKAIENAARARGIYYSPSTVKELTRYGQDFASNEFGNVYNRLAGVAGMGQSAVNTSGQMGQQYASNMGNIYQSDANARGAAGIASANSWGGAITGAANNYQQQNMLKDLFKSPQQYSNGFRNSFAWS